VRNSERGSRRCPATSQRLNTIAYHAGRRKATRLGAVQTPANGATKMHIRSAKSKERETLRISDLKIKRFENGDAMFIQGKDCVYLTADQLIAMSDFLFHHVSP
jgi:cystathionine beta-lyase/cystathionine gamma-synthase